MASVEQNKKKEDLENYLKELEMCIRDRVWICLFVRREDCPETFLRVCLENH